MPLLALTVGQAYATDKMALQRQFTLHGVTNEQTYKRVNDFMHACHHGVSGLTSTDISGEIYPDAKTSEVRATFHGGMIPETITTQEVAGDTHVTLATIHRLFKWDTKELDAAQRSIESGTPSCR